MGCAKGHAALCDDAVDAILAVVGEMMKPGRDARGGRRGRAMWGLPPILRPLGGKRSCHGRERADESASPDAEQVLADGEIDGLELLDQYIQGERQRVASPAMTLRPPTSCCSEEEKRTSLS